MACRPDGAADFVANVAAFVPLGAALAWAGLSGRRAVAAGALLSLAIELVQATGLAGRTAVLGDVLANAVGTAAGAGAVLGAPVFLHPSRRAARRLAAAGGGAWLLVMTASAWLLGRAPSAGPWPPRPNARPTVPDHGWYHGRVAGLTLDGWTITHAGAGPLIVAARLGRASRAAATLVGGDARRNFVPAVAVLDAERAPVLLLGQRGAAAELRVRTRATDWRLRDPVLVVPGALASLCEGNLATRAALDATLDPDRYALTVRATGVGPTLAARGAFRIGPGAGWVLIVPVARSWGPEAGLLDGVWIATLLVPVGYWLPMAVRARRGAAARWVGAGAGLLTLGLVVGPRLVGAPGGTGGDAIVAVAALLVGAWGAATRLPHPPGPASLQG